MKKIKTLLLALLPLYALAQNVGVGTSTPTEKLDVSGNINVTGTIKANGTDGNAGQVLMKNSSGNLVWGDMCEFKNTATFTTPIASNWTVPAGVTRVMIEVWGAGGGGCAFAGGGGGGYIRGIFTVAPGNNIAYSIGLGGSASGSAATNGELSTVTVGAVTLSAFGGQGAQIAAGVISNCDGGAYNATAGFTNYIGMKGDAGAPKIFNYYSNGVATYHETSGGNGGDAGNTTGTGGIGRLRVYNITGAAETMMGPVTGGKQPGGGGGSGPGGLGLPTTGVGSTGAAGMVIIHY